MQFCLNATERCHTESASQRCILIKVPRMLWPHDMVIFAYLDYTAGVKRTYFPVPYSNLFQICMAANACTGGLLSPGAW